MFTMMLLHIYQVFSSLRDHLHFLEHFFFMFMVNFFLTTPYYSQIIHGWFTGTDLFTKNSRAQMIYSQITHQHRRFYWKKLTGTDDVTFPYFRDGTNSEGRWINGDSTQRSKSQLSVKRNRSLWLHGREMCGIVIYQSRGYIYDAWEIRF